MYAALRIEQCIFYILGLLNSAGQSVAAAVYPIAKRRRSSEQALTTFLRQVGDLHEWPVHRIESRNLADKSQPNWRS
jgi:hypothetical protein